MNTSDLFTLIGLVLAIIAFLNEEDRKFILNKFSGTNKFCLLIVFIFLNFLVYYKYWSNNFNFLNHFEIQNFPLPKTWAYLISLLTILYLLIKIFYSKFPKANYNKLKTYYKSLLHKKENLRIINYLLKYNLDDIKEYIQGNKNELNSFLFENILKNSYFLKATASFNLDLFEIIFRTYKSNDYKLLHHFLISQFSTKDSFFNNNIDNEKAIEFINVSVLETKKMNILIENNINNSATDITKLFKYLHFLYLTNDNLLDSGIKDADHIILQQLLSAKKQVEIVKYFKSYLDVLNKCTLNNFTIFLESFILSINNHNILNKPTIINMFLKSSLTFYEDINKSDLFIKKFNSQMEINDNKNLRLMIIDVWEKNHKNSGFNKDIIKIISNY